IWRRASQGEARCAIAWAAPTTADAPPPARSAAGDDRATGWTGPWPAPRAHLPAPPTADDRPGRHPPAGGCHRLAPSVTLPDARRGTDPRPGCALIALPQHRQGN